MISRASGSISDVCSGVVVSRSGPEYGGEATPCLGQGCKEGRRRRYGVGRTAHPVELLLAALGEQATRSVTRHRNVYLHIFTFNCIYFYIFIFSCVYFYIFLFSCVHLSIFLFISICFYLLLYILIYFCTHKYVHLFYICIDII